MYHYYLTKVHKGYVYIKTVILIYSFLYICVCVSGGGLSALEGKGNAAGSVLPVCHTGCSLGTSLLLPTPGHLVCSTNVMFS